MTPDDGDGRSSPDGEGQAVNSVENTANPTRHRENSESALIRRAAATVIQRNDGVIDAFPGGAATVLLGAGIGIDPSRYRKDAYFMETENPAEQSAATPSRRERSAHTIQWTEPGLDELLQHIRALAVELDHCIVRLAHTSSAGIPDRDRRIANSSAAEWVRRSLEDIIATSAGIRFAAEDPQPPVRAAQESLAAPG
jgi:hypothetical protein